MKRILLPLLLIVAVLSNSSIFAQCGGLKNPVNFTFYNSPITGQYTGKTGTKPYTASNCNNATVGMNFTTEVSNANLATVTSSQSASYCGQTISDNSRFRIMSNTEGPGTGANLGKDPLTNFALPYVPTSDPTFSKSIRIGNCRISAEAEALYYTMQVTPSNALVFINYAIVAQAPTHGVTGNPEFVIRVMHQDNAGNWVQISDTLCYVVSTTLTSAGGTVTIGQNGWHQVGTGYDQVFYKDWAQVAINLYKYLYSTVRIEVMTGDCAASGHYAYAYIAGDCQPMTLNPNGCAAGEGVAVAEIHAPKGLSEYQWYRSVNGLLNGEQREVESNYQLMQGMTDSVLQVTIDHMRTNAGDTARQSTFKCKMTSYMDPAKPVFSTLIGEVGNMKPTVLIDSLPLCDGSVHLKNTSYTPFTISDNDNVDTTNTVWEFFNTSTPGLTPIHTAYGPSATFTYDAPGQHCVRIRTSTYDTACWNRKVIPIRSLSPTTPIIQPARNYLCAGDTIVIMDRTPGTIYRKWHLTDNFGLDTTWEGSSQQAFQRAFYHTTTVSVTAHTATHYLQDTNYDGILDRIYCDATADTIIYVEDYPTLNVVGDTIVCNGNTSVVNVSSDVPNCTFDWYIDLNNAPIQTNSSTLTTQPTNDVRYWVKATSPYGCVSFNHLDISLVKPNIAFTTPYFPRAEICTGDTAKLWGGKASTFTWTCSPDTDPTFWGQENNDTIIVSPTETCVYTVVGHGTNGCSATALSQQIIVRPYPTLGVNLTPDYIDSDNPSVQFSDISENSASSLWNFSNGQTSSIKSVVHTFTDLSQDSILISLISANSLGCSRDTTFWIPVGIFTVWFPNAFTPRLETNKIFKAFTANQLRDYELCVYDRNGLLIFQTNDPEMGWDGTFKGEECPTGSYVYISKYRRPDMERLQSQKGTVLLLK